ncbi:MAG: DUF4254 domain-containing protein [Candidatus Krumholzibacteriia bacterium]
MSADPPPSHSDADPRRVPPDGRSVQPILWDVIERWHAAVTGEADWEAAQDAVSPRQPEGWAAVVERLQLINTYQWHEEDRSRQQGADDASLAAVKRSIDASNARRVRTVDQLDEIIISGLVDAGLMAPGAPLPSESAGSIIDRLTVLALKIYHLKEALAEVRGRPDTARRDLELLHARVRSVTEQHADLTECLDRLLDDVRAGRLRLKLYRQVKLYRDPETGAMRTDLD